MFPFASLNGQGWSDSYQSTKAAAHLAGFLCALGDSNPARTLSGTDTIPLLSKK